MSLPNSTKSKTHLVKRNTTRRPASHNTGQIIAIPNPKSTILGMIAPTPTIICSEVVTSEVAQGTTSTAESGPSCHTKFRCHPSCAASPSLYHTPGWCFWKSGVHGSGKVSGKGGPRDMFTLSLVGFKFLKMAETIRTWLGDVGSMCVALVSQRSLRNQTMVGTSYFFGGAVASKIQASANGNKITTSEIGNLGASSAARSLHVSKLMVKTKSPSLRRTGPRRLVMLHHPSLIIEFLTHNQTPNIFQTRQLHKLIERITSHQRPFTAHVK